MLQRISVTQFAIGKTDYLIKYTQCIPHATLALLGDDLQRRLFRLDLFFRTDILQMPHRIRPRDPLEIENLTTGKNGRKYLVLFRGSQNENGIRRRLLQRLQKSVKSRSA